MKIQEILNSDECCLLFREVQEFVKKSLSEYNESIKKNGFVCSDKDIFDFVWGTIEFTKAEICILDSPLLQRLRRIRQLGLASMVYCNADSSRFSHTIGVTEVASRMAKAVRRGISSDYLKGADEDFQNFDMVEVVRLAAIFHDTGHMFYSHVSETYFSYDRSFPRYSEITRAKAYFCQQVSKEVSLHELISVMIVHSPETLELFRLIEREMNSKLSKDDHFELLAEFISCLIIGQPSNRMLLPYSMIINGALDADKFDYLQRDSQCTRVPIAVDVARIIGKLAVLEIREIGFSLIWDDSKSQDIHFQIMAIRNSARNVFFQLSNARSSMYESVYYHHKVLTAEMMFRDVLRKIYSLKEASNISFCDILMLTDDAFNDQWRYSLLPEIEESSESIIEIDSYLKKIRNRDLYKRVAAFSQNLIIATKAAKEDFLNQIAQNPFSEDSKVFKERLLDEYIKIGELLDLKLEQNPVFMFIYSKYDAMDPMPVESKDGLCIWSSELMKQDTIEAGKKSKQEQYYLVTNCADRVPVFLALEKVLVKYNIIGLKRESFICSKISTNTMNKTRKKLLQKDYYIDALYILDDDFLQNEVYDSLQIKKIVDKYQTFMGVKNCKITNDRLLKYLRQYLYFEIPYRELKIFFDGLLQILVRATYLDRDSAVQGFSELLSNKVSKLTSDNIHAICLGGAFDSSNHLYYYFNDIKDKKAFTFYTTVENALKDIRDGEYVCFWDDGAYSGKQVSSIFQEMMGVPEGERATNEHHVDELKDNYKEKLKKANIVLAYLFFNEEKESYIRDNLKALGIHNLQIVYNNSISQKFFDDIRLYRDDRQDIVKKYLKLAGQSILESTKKDKEGNFKERWDSKRIEEAGLGYNDAQQIIIFNNNIPTYSLTALWANGKVSGHNWEGLFQRTDKD